MDQTSWSLLLSSSPEYSSRASQNLFRGRSLAIFDNPGEFTNSIPILHSPVTSPARSVSPTSSSSPTSIIPRRTLQMAGIPPNNNQSRGSSSSASKKKTTRTRGENGRFQSSVDPNTRICFACGTSDTTQWRTGPDGSTLCNPCGIRLNRKSSSPTESATAAKKRAEVQRATAAAQANAAKKKKKNGSPPRKSQPTSGAASISSPRGAGSSSAHAGSASSSHSPPRSSSERSKKKRRDAYDLNTLLNPQ